MIKSRKHLGWPRPAALEVRCQAIHSLLYQLIYVLYLCLVLNCYESVYYGLCPYVNARSTRITAGCKRRILVTRRMAIRRINYPDIDTAYVRDTNIWEVRWAPTRRSTLTGPRNVARGLIMPTPTWRRGTVHEGPIWPYACVAVP